MGLSFTLGGGGKPGCGILLSVFLRRVGRGPLGWSAERSGLADRLCRAYLCSDGFRGSSCCLIRDTDLTSSERSLYPCPPSCSLPLLSPTHKTSLPLNLLGGYISPRHRQRHRPAREPKEWALLSTQLQHSGRV